MIAMVRPQAVAIRRLGDAAADLGGGQLLVADEIERPHDAGDRAEQSQERGERHGRSQHPLQAFGIFQFRRRPQLHGAEERAMGVQEALLDGGQKRIGRLVGERQRPLEIAGGNRFVHLLQPLAARASRRAATTR